MKRLSPHQVTSMNCDALQMSVSLPLNNGCPVKARLISLNRKGPILPRESIGNDTLLS